MGKRRSGNRDFVGKIKGKRSHGKPRLGGNIIIKYIFKI
jgi:hypothetical protein